MKKVVRQLNNIKIVFQDGTYFAYAPDETLLCFGELTFVENFVINNTDYKRFKPSEREQSLYKELSELDEERGKIEYRMMEIYNELHELHKNKHRTNKDV